MLTRPQDRPKPEPPQQEPPEPLKLVDIEVTDIDIQYPDGVFVALTLRADKGDSFKYALTGGGQTVLRVQQGSSEAHYNLNLAFYHAFRQRTIKVPEPKYIPPSAEPSAAPPEQYY